MCGEGDWRVSDAPADMQNRRVEITGPTDRNWVHHGAELDDGRTVTADLVRELETEELEKIRAEIGDDEWFEREGRPDLSRELVERVALSEEFEEFLTLPALERLPD